MSYESQKQQNPDYDPTQPEGADMGKTSSKSPPKYSVGMGSLMDGRTNPQLKTKTMPQRLVGEGYGVLDFLKPSTARTTNGNHQFDMFTMNADIDRALKQSDDAFTVAKASWNNQIEYFKVSFGEIDRRQEALAASFRTLAATLANNARLLDADQKNIDSKPSWRIYPLAKALVGAIKRIVGTFSSQSKDFTNVKTEMANLAHSFGKLASNVSKLKYIK